MWVTSYWWSLTDLRISSYAHACDAYETSLQIHIPSSTAVWWYVPFISCCVFYVYVCVSIVPNIMVLSSCGYFPLWPGLSVILYFLVLRDYNGVQWGSPGSLLRTELRLHSIDNQPPADTWSQWSVGHTGSELASDPRSPSHLQGHHYSHR